MLRFSIDRGGTFTDVYAEEGDGAKRYVLKLLSEDPGNYPNAPREGIRRILERATGIPHPRDEPLDHSRIEWIRMGTTVATNGLLEREGTPFVLVVTAGFKDALEIGTQARPKIFDIRAKKLPPLYSAVIEAKERVRVDKTSTSVVLPLDEDLLVRDLRRARDELGLASCAVAFAHSYAFPDHERRAGEIARNLGFTQVSVSCDLLPMSKLVSRGQTACVDAYLTPLIRAYLESFVCGFADDDVTKKVLFMQSDGGLVKAEKFTGFRAVLSGPAGGVVGYAKTTTSANLQRHVGAVVGFDMGGTSTDVSRFDKSFEHVLETETAGVKIQCPQLDVNTVAAGGGSRLFFRQGALVVGPESAKAHPGPVCYRKQGYLAVTDANLFLGRLLPHRFPKIFGPNEDQPLDRDASARALLEIARDVDDYFGKGAMMTPEKVASGFVRVANETMCRPIRELSEARGFDPADHTLACFGGAGAQHVCALARSLGIRQAVVHAYAGILSAYGIGLADVVVDKTSPCANTTTLPYTQALRDQHDALEQAARRELDDGDNGESIVAVERLLNLRYRGTDNAIMVEESEIGYEAALAQTFKREYGFELKNTKKVEVDDCRVRVISSRPQAKRPEVPAGDEREPVPVETCRMYFDETGWVEQAPVYELDQLRSGNVVDGPSIIAVGTSTCVVDPGCRATVTKYGDIVISIPPVAGRGGDGKGAECFSSGEEEEEADPAQLGVFGHRFMSIAEQMGRTLQRTSTSVNIKERLDFSCALFGADGGLVANAPHVPVHLGAMSETVKAQLAKTELGPGDVVVANDPNAGGSHLPDITVITPIFFDGENSPAFFSASRGHHADVGGSTPGSMPADSTRLDEEGAVFDAFLMVKKGVFDEEATIDILNSPATKGSGLSACRNLSDVLSDLKAQVAANAKGAHLLRELCAEYGRPVVAAYMRHVRENAAACVRAALKEIAEKHGGGPVVVLLAEDRMDDGNPICLQLTIKAPDGPSSKASAIFDFSRGTGPEVRGNWNAPRAITSAAVMYCLRLLVGRDIPLNSGCLDPVTIIFGDTRTMLSPSPRAAVCAGNVLTSMRITDVVLKAVEACAASQGCMNNLTFGDETFGYYETIAGGSGAGPCWNGTDAIQCHMTNTRITDVETLEKRYPIHLDAFCIRRGSGGAGRYRGGDGVLRQMTFLKRCTVNLLTERRAIAPFGLRGGGDGARGRNTLILPDKRMVNLGAKTKLVVEKGTTLRIETPGGGGYGKPPSPSDSEPDDAETPRRNLSRGDDLSQLHTTPSIALGANAVDF